MAVIHEHMLPRFEQSKLEENQEVLSNGMYISLSSMLCDFARDHFPPKSKEVFSISKGVFSALAERDIAIGGSMWSYELQRMVGKTARRGTFSAAITAFMHSSVTHSDALSARAIKDLAYGSDVDVYLLGVTHESFPQVNTQLLQRLRRTIGIPLVSTVFERRKDSQRTQFPTRCIIQAPHAELPGYPFSDRRIVHAHLEQGTVSDIPYSEVMLQAAGGNVVTFIWTPGDLSTFEGQDDRQDPKFALSWDVASAKGKRTQLPLHAKQDAIKAIEARKQMITPWEKRFAHHNGVFAPAPYSDIENDVWFHISGEEISLLGRPIEIGAAFSKLPIFSQVALGFRAVYKGTAFEENLTLTSEGRRALHDRHGKAPALSEATTAALQNISLEAFQQAYAGLSVPEQQRLQYTLLKPLIVGMFYPQRFIAYCQQTYMFRFFPHLAALTDLHWQRVLSHFPTLEEYAARQYAATHYLDTGYTGRMPLEIPVSEEIAWHSEQARENQKAFMNPYKMFVDALRQEAFINIPNDWDYFQVVDELLSFKPSMQLYMADDPNYVSHLNFVPIHTIVDLRHLQREADIYWGRGRALRSSAKWIAGVSALSGGYAAISLWSGDPAGIGGAATGVLLGAQTLGASWGLKHVAEVLRRRGERTQRTIARIRGELQEETKPKG